jgi:hypothetical protein
VLADGCAVEATNGGSLMAMRCVTNSSSALNGASLQARIAAFAIMN